jgi:hypothetical protein
MRWPYTCAVAVPSTAPGLAVWATHGLGWPHGLRVDLVGGGGALAASTVRRQGWQQARVRTGEKSSHGIGTR